MELEADAEDKKAKPKRSSLPKGWEPASIDLDQALRLLRLPREVALHPRTTSRSSRAWAATDPTCSTRPPTPASATSRRCSKSARTGPWTLLAEKRAGGGRAARGAPAALKELGAHPVSGEPIRVLAGRYGPYVNAGKFNANVPKVRTLRRSRSTKR